jgi:hypothetical protein
MLLQKGPDFKSQSTRPLPVKQSPVIRADSDTNPEITDAD